MTKRTVRSILILGTLLANFTINAQVTTLSENFDVKCVLGMGTPTGWIKYNPITVTDPPGAWQCTATDGRAGTSGPTPGVECTGVYGSPPAFHLDTSYLLTPKLDISGYPTGPIYLRFDTKTDLFTSGAKIALLETTDTALGTYIDSTTAMFPMFTNDDSTRWITHQIDISAFKASPFYIAFRYTSTTATGSTWRLDNVNITTASVLEIPGTAAPASPLTVIGIPTANEITISYNAAPAANTLGIYDMLGREVHKELLNLQQGQERYAIKGLDLRSGMYIIKVSDGLCNSFAKVMVQ